VIILGINLGKMKFIFLNLSKESSKNELEQTIIILLSKYILKINA